jgi:hypothetical protein
MHVEQMQLVHDTIYRRIRFCSQVIKNICCSQELSTSGIRSRAHAERLRDCTARIHCLQFDASEVFNNHLILHLRHVLPTWQSPGEYFLRRTWAHISTTRYSESNGS